MKDQEKLINIKDIEIPKPSKETVVGFIIAWVFVVLLILGTVILAKIGS